MVRVKHALVVSVLLTAGCGTLPVGSGTASGTTGRLATGSTIGTTGVTATTAKPNSVVEDASRLDLTLYLKVARLYCWWNLSEVVLDYAGSHWLDGDGYAIAGSAGWTFGYFHQPEYGNPQKRDYAVLHVDQKHALTRGLPTDVAHRGISPLYLDGLLSPRKAIQEALKQNLPQGDRYAVEFLSSGASEPPMSVVTSFRAGWDQGRLSLVARK